jgi:hypothetical protein
VPRDREPEVDVLDLRAAPDVVDDEGRESPQVFGQAENRRLMSSWTLTSKSNPIAR